MGKIDLMQIVLDKPSHVYLNGETVRGRVHLHVTDTIKLNFIELSIKGEVNVSWDETMYSVQYKSKAKHTFSNHESVCYYEQFIVPKKEVGDVIMQGGDHDYPFEYTLPSDCPSSFEHTHARVRYSIKVHVDIPWDFDMYGAMSFSVINMYDLNQEKNSLIKPVGLNQTIGGKSCCCFTSESSDPIMVKFSIRKTGFVPGEYIHFKVDVTNNSTHELDNIRVKVVQKVHIKADGKGRTYRHSLGFMALHKKIHPHSKELWDTAYHIPPVCPTLKNLSHILDIKYFFILFIDFDSSLEFVKEMSIPIQIGTVPLNEDKFVVQGGKAIVQGTKFAVTPNHTFEAVEHEQDKPPAYSYAEKGEALLNDADTYKPQYPYFKDFKKNNGVEEPTVVENLTDNNTADF